MSYRQSRPPHERESVVVQQLIHMALGTLIFVVLAGLAIGLDLAGQWVARLGVSSFVSDTLVLVSHVLFILDLVLFAAYLLKSSIEFLKELFS